MKRIGVVALIATAGLLLAGCGEKQEMVDRDTGMTAGEMEAYCWGYQDAKGEPVGRSFAFCDDFVVKMFEPVTQAEYEENN